MNKKELQELINLLYNNNISQSGKRKLEKYIKEMQKEIEDLKIITRAYNSYICDDVNFKILIADARYFFYDGGYFVNRFISKDKIKEKIGEYNKKCDKCNFQNSGICKEFKAHYNCSIQSVLELLKELLEE